LTYDVRWLSDGLSWCMNLSHKSCPDSTFVIPSDFAVALTCTACRAPLRRNGELLPCFGYVQPLVVTLQGKTLTCISDYRRGLDW
jgi:hypothetical protein